MIHLLDAIYSRPWALHPITMALILQVAERWASGVRLSAEEVQAAVGDAPQTNAARAQAAAASGGGSVAVIPAYGILTARQYAVENSSSPLTSSERLGMRVSAAAADPEIGAIVIDFDTPGGDAMGVSEASARITAAAQIKPVIGVVNSQAASGGYWLASQCSELVMAPDSMVGSIGVRMAHVDASKYYESKGLRITHIHSGKYKVEGADTGPLSDETRSYLQAMSDELYASFTKAVAKGRNLPLDTVRGAAFGEGRMLLAKDAVAAGMADRIDTLENTIARYAKKRNQKGMSSNARARALAIAARLPAGPDRALAQRPSEDGALGGPTAASVASTTAKEPSP
jgi:signal peptide peptidase SppA